MARLKSLSGMVGSDTYEFCKSHGSGNPGVGMRLLLEEAIVNQSERHRLLNEVLEKCLDRMELMGDVTLAMRSEQNLLMSTLDALLSEAKNHTDTHTKIPEKEE